MKMKKKLLVLSYILVNIIVTINIFKPVYVISGSMEPTIMTNSINLIIKCSIDDININDIVMYRRLNGVNVIHRVNRIESDRDSLEKVVICKGDMNNDIDRDRISEDMIVGKAVMTIGSNGIKLLNIDKLLLIRVITLVISYICLNIGYRILNLKLACNGAEREEV